MSRVTSGRRQGQSVMVVTLGVLSLAACGGHGHSDGLAGTATSPPPPSKSPAGFQTPPLHPPVQSFDCGSDSNGINVSSGPYGPGSLTAPAEQAAQVAGHFMVKYPDAKQTLVYEDEARQDFAYQEADGTMRGYVSFVLKDGLWASNGEAFCSRA